MTIGAKTELRPFEPSDVDGLRLIVNHAGLAGRRFLPRGFSADLPLSIRDGERLIEKWLGADEEVNLAIDSIASDRLVGYVNFGWGWDDHCPWGAVVIDPSEWRRGLGSEALDSMLGHVFGTTVAHTISCWLPEWNKEGLGFAKKHGFRAMGRIRRAGLRDGAWYDTIPVDLLRSEWMERMREDDLAASG